MSDRLRFTSPKAKTTDLPFDLVGQRQVRDDDGRVVDQVEVEQAFEAKAAVSYGVLLDDLLGDRGAGGDGTWSFFETCLVERNTAPGARWDTERGEALPEDEDDERSEFDRFREFVTDPDLYFHPDTIIDVARALTEQSAGRPTEQPAGSRSTRRAAGRGAPRKR